MNIKNIEGGVSPLKAKRQPSRGGEHAGKATAKKGTYLGGRGGYAKSVGVRGGGGRNVGGYNIHTRFEPTTRFSDDISPSTKTNKPYSYDKDGNLVVDTDIGYEYKQGPSTTTTKESGGSYEEVWNSDAFTIKDGKRVDKYGHEYSDDEAGLEEFKKAAKKYNESETKTVAGKEYKRKWTSKGDGPKEYDINDNTDSEGWYEI